MESLDQVYIATDNYEIFSVAEKAGAKVIMTSGSHISGTERVSEAAGMIFHGDSLGEVIINIQGDEPLINKEAISGLCDAFLDDSVNIATLMHKSSDQVHLTNPNRPKVVTDLRKNALYFSRSMIPWQTFPGDPFFFLHIGVYAFRLNILKEISQLAPAPLEISERLEQLRWIENGFSIRCVETMYSGVGIDTPEDLEQLNRYLDSRQGL